MLHSAGTRFKQSWSGLWRAPLILQTFAHHFNFIQGRVEVPVLEHELSGPRAALALACAAVSYLAVDDRTLLILHNRFVES